MCQNCFNKTKTSNNANLSSPEQLPTPLTTNLEVPALAWIEIPRKPSASRSHQSPAQVLIAPHSRANLTDNRDENHFVVVYFFFASRAPVIITTCFVFFYSTPSNWYWGEVHPAARRRRRRRLINDFGLININFIQRQQSAFFFSFYLKIPKPIEMFRFCVSL